MRTFMVAEVFGHRGDLYGAGYNEMREKLVKRGWIEQVRSPAHSLGSFNPIFQRRNYYRSTAKGRRAIYKLDRYSNSPMRKHSLSTNRGRVRRELAMWWDGREQKRLDEMTKYAQHLHPSKRKGLK